MASKPMGVICESKTFLGSRRSESQNQRGDRKRTRSDHTHIAQFAIVEIELHTKRSKRRVSDFMIVREYGE
jgi:hypothetical protein